MGAKPIAELAQSPMGARASCWVLGKEKGLGGSEGLGSGLDSLGLADRGAGWG
jgi:hypothetical protein